MGVTKQYLRVAPGPVFGVVASQKSNIICLPGDNSQAARCAVGACENVYIWDLSKKEKVVTLSGERHEVTALAKSSRSNCVAVGYADGSIKIFNLDTCLSDVTFQGHKSAVTCLAYDGDGLRLASGSKDTDVILWDVVSESGVFRLKGHRKEVTQVTFLKHRNVIVTSSKDTYIKFWDIETQHCFYTVVGHRTEVYAFVLLRDDCRLVSGSGDSELRVWDIHYFNEEDVGAVKTQNDGELPTKRRKIDAASDVDPSASDEEKDEEEKAEDEAMRILKCKKVGSVMRQGRDRVVTLCTDPSEKLLICHGTDKHFETFLLPSSDDLNKLKAKRIKKLRKKHLNSVQDVDTSNVQLKLEDEVRQVERFRFSSKLSSLTVISDAGQLRICALLSDNKVETGVLNLDKNKCALGPVVPLAQHGHRTDVRTLSFSADNTTILSASSEEMKLWNRDSMQCVRTCSCDYALCSMFVSGDRHAVIGTKTGKLQLFDINQGVLLETIEAHKGAVWSVAAMPDKRGLISGGADREVKFWNYELVADKSQDKKQKVLTLEHTRTLKMDEDVLCVKFTPDHRLLAVSLLDSTVKVFFVDTLKFFLSLYGHKLPVVCMDISSDSTLIVTGSADRNIKIWGLDFGDCHKSIFAHDESVTCLEFVPKTHLFFSGGKDRKIKQWDADNFEHIITLEGHHAEVRCLAVSPSGGTVVSASHDKSLRLWEKTEEALVLEEEKEMEREKEEVDSLLKDGEEIVPGETSQEVKMAGKKTIETIKGTEHIMEALEIYENQMEELKQAQGQKGVTYIPHPMMVAYKCVTPSDFVLETIRRIRASELNGALLSLPFSYVSQLLPVLDHCLSRHMETELVSKCLNFLLKIHHGEVTSSHIHLPIIENLKEHSLKAVEHHKLELQWEALVDRRVLCSDALLCVTLTNLDLTAFNMAGLTFLRKHVEEANGVMMFADATSKRKKKKRAVLAVK